MITSKAVILITMNLKLKHSPDYCNSLSEVSATNFNAKVAAANEHRYSYSVALCYLKGELDDQ